MIARENTLRGFAPRLRPFRSSRFEDTMHKHRLQSILLALCLCAAAAAFAQTPEFKPEVGQPGKDVVWVPTSQVLVDKMLDMAKVTASDYVIDLGSGDGRTVITAAKRGARALGIEYNPDMVELSKRNAAEAGVGERARFMKADIFESDFSQATVITLFLLPDLNLKLRPKILSLKPGTRIVANSFTMGEWQDDETATVDAKAGCNYWCIAHFWIVPAKVEGTWNTSRGEMTLGQQFQMVSGSLRSSGTQVTINGRLRGDQVSFTAGPATYTGRVNGDSIEGTVSSGGTVSKWTAARAK
jgi:precorrin-6B methylase 2